MTPQRMQQTPFDEHADRANAVGFHNHRDNSHSDIISDGLVSGLREVCPSLRRHLDAGTVGCWKNQPNPWGRKRNTDLVIADPLKSSLPATLPPTPYPSQGAASMRGAKPDNTRVRIVIEHKSVITAHRNRSARHDDLNNLSKEAAGESRVVVAATVMVGMAARVLNVPDRIMPRYYAQSERSGRLVRKLDEERFNREVLARLRAHDPKLLNDFPDAVSYNTPRDIEDTLAKFGTLRLRPPDDRTKPGLDALLLVPVYYDNVGPARVARDNPYDINVDAAYQAFLQRIAGDYDRIWSGSTG